MIEYVLVDKEEQYQAAAGLFRQYANWLGIDLCFQGFEEELTMLDQMYGPPSGGIRLCRHEGNWVGSVAVRQIGDGVAELKRMYLLPAFQGRGIGKQLLNRALALASSIGYHTIRLDTLNHMTPAMNLYRSAGFYEIPAYYHNPEPAVVYFEKKLNAD